MIKVIRSPVSCASNVASSNCASQKVEKVAGEFGETMTISVTTKDQSEHNPPIAIGVRGSVARPVLHADLHHAAQLQAIQTEVGKVGGGSKGREHLHGGLHFRIVH